MLVQAMPKFFWAMYQITHNDFGSTAQPHSTFDTTLVADTMSLDEDRTPSAHDAYHTLDPFRSGGGGEGSTPAGSASTSFQSEWFSMRPSGKNRRRKHESMTACAEKSGNPGIEYRV